MSYINLLIVAWRGIEPLNSSVIECSMTYIASQHSPFQASSVMRVRYRFTGPSSRLRISRTLFCVNIPHHDFYKTRVNTQQGISPCSASNSRYTPCITTRIFRGGAGVVRGSTKSLYPQLLYPAVCIAICL